MIVGQTERLSRCYPTTILAAGMLVICGWISPVAHAGPNLSKENFSKELLEAQGDLRGAEATYASSLQIVLKLVSQDPTNRVRLRELSVIHSRLGGVLKAQGDIAGATRNFRASIEILTNLIQEHGQNSSLEWDLDWTKAQLREG